MATAQDPSLEMLTHSAPFRRCTESQRVFLLEYLTSGDQQAAVRKGYPDAKDSSLASMAWQVLQSDGIKETLNWFRFRNAEASRETLIDMVRKAVENCEPGSVAHSRCLAQLERLTLGHDVPPVRDVETPQIRPSKDPMEPAAKHEAFHIGQKVTQKDEEGRTIVGIVRAIGADGEPIVDDLKVGHER